MMHLTGQNFRKCNYNHHPLHGKKIAASASSFRPGILLDENCKVIQGGILTDLLGAIGDFYGFQYTMDTSIAPFMFLPNGTLGGSLGDVSTVHRYVLKPI